MVFYLSFSTPIDNDDCNDQGGQRTVTRSNKKIYDRKKMKFAAKALITLALVCSKFKGGDPFTLSPLRRSFPPQREPLSTTCFQQSTRPEGKISLKDIHDALVDLNEVVKGLQNDVEKKVGRVEDEFGKMKKKVGRVEDEFGKMKEKVPEIDKSCKSTKEDLTRVKKNVKKLKWWQKIFDLKLRVLDSGY